MSSANNNKVGVDTDVGRSLMKIKKSSGPKILPCGTPETTGTLVSHSTVVLCI